MAQSNEEFSVKEKEAIEKLRGALQDVFQQQKHAVNDYDLIRWLRARDLNVQKAEKMYRASLVWREKWRLDTTLEEYEPLEVLLKYYSYNMLGFSKNGRCVVGMAKVGSLDMKGLVQSVSRDDFARFIFWRVEGFVDKMRKRTEETGKPTNRLLFIQDAEGLSLSQVFYRPAMELSKFIMEAYEDNYPELLSTMFIINAPRIFTIVFSVFSRFLSEATVNKIKVFGTNREKWIPVLLEHVDADVLPVAYGGTRTDPDGDPNCRSIIGQGGKVPKSYYLDKKERIKGNDKLKSHTVEKGGELRLDFLVHEQGSVLRWEFMTEGYDISFGVELESEDNASVEEVLPVERVQSHVDVQEGEWTCEKTGKYVVIFDNSYSYLRAKQIYFDVRVCPPVKAAGNNNED